MSSTRTWSLATSMTAEALLLAVLVSLTAGSAGWTTAVSVCGPASSIFTWKLSRYSRSLPS